MTAESCQKRSNKHVFKYNQIFGFPCCSTREDLYVDASITTVGLIGIDEAMVISFLGVRSSSGYGETDLILESPYGNMTAHKKFQLEAPY